MSWKDKLILLVFLQEFILGTHKKERDSDIEHFIEQANG